MARGLPRNSPKGVHDAQHDFPNKINRRSSWTMVGAHYPLLLFYISIEVSELYTSDYIITPGNSSPSHHTDTAIPPQELKSTLSIGSLMCNLKLFIQLVVKPRAIVAGSFVIIHSIAFGTQLKADQFKSWGYHEKGCVWERKINKPYLPLRHRILTGLTLQDGSIPLSL